MRASKRAIVRAFRTGQVAVQPCVQGSSRRLQRDADTIVQAATDHLVRGSRNMKGLQPFACI
jgi:hypothetical protein